MKLDTVDNSSALVMYTMVAAATVQAFTAFDQDNGASRRRYSYGDTSVCAMTLPPGFEEEHEESETALFPTIADDVLLVLSDISCNERLPLGSVRFGEGDGGILGGGGADFDRLGEEGLSN